MNPIICIGEALIDMICTDKDITLANGNHFIKKPGGAPTNVAAAIAALGGQVSLVAKVGTDPFGQHLASTMETIGVGTQYLFRDAAHFTTIAFVSLLANGERDFVFNRGADGQLSIQDIDTIPMQDYSIFHFGSATCFLPSPLSDAYQHCMQKAVQQGSFISFDPNYRQDLLKAHLPLFIHNSLACIRLSHFCKLSDSEALQLTGAGSITEAATVLMNQYAATFTITLGKEGTLLCHNQEIQLVPSISITPIDTTGAGDAFVGAMLYLLSQKNRQQLLQLTMADWVQMVQHANKAGARTCEYIGAMEAFKHLHASIFDEPIVS